MQWLIRGSIPRVAADPPWYLPFRDPKESVIVDWLLSPCWYLIEYIIGLKGHIYILFIIIYSLFNCILYQKALHLVDQWTSFKFSLYLRLFAPYRPMKRSGNSPWLPWFPGATRQLGSSCQNFGRSAGLSRAFFVGVSCMASLQNYDHSNYPLVN